MQGERIVLPADPTDPEDGDVTAEAMDRGQRVRMLRKALGLSTSECIALLNDPAKIDELTARLNARE
jgi:putative transcriptional regulator